MGRPSVRLLARQRPDQPRRGPQRRWRHAGRLAFLAAVAGGGYLGLVIAAATPARYTAVEFLLVLPPPGSHQSPLQTTYTSGVQRVVTDMTGTRADLGVRLVVAPDMPLIEIDATAGSGEAAVARAGTAAVVAEQAWREHSGGAGPRLLRALPTAVSAQRTSPSAAIDGVVGAFLGGTAATVAAAARDGRPSIRDNEVPS